ncbi:MAG: hypothetical protein WCW35_05945 [Bacteroidota bacterium]
MNLAIRKTFIVATLLPIAGILFITSGCEDLLPVYIEPDNIFEASLVSVDSTLVQYYETDEKDLTPEGPIINYQSFTSDFRISVSVKNLYEETLQNTAAVSGKLEIWNELHPEEKATIPITTSNIASGSGYNASTNSITLNPNEKLFFTIRWNYRFDSKKWLHQTVGSIGQQAISARSWYLFYPLVHLKSRATIQLFKNTKAVISEDSFPVQLRGYIAVTQP